MARYIDADALKNDGHLCWYNGKGTTYYEVDHAPTADVTEVIHAKWEISSDGYYPYCTNCKTEPKNGVRSKYCPECGARMGGA